MTKTRTDSSPSPKPRSDLLNGNDIYRLALRASPQPMSLSRLCDGVLVDASDSFCHFTGCDRPSLLGRKAVDLGLWCDPTQREALMLAVKAAGEVLDFEARVRAHDGEIRTHQICATLIDSQPEPLVLSIGHDITDQAAAQIRLRELSSIVEQTSDAIMLTAPDGSIQYVNPGFERMTGYGRDEVIGKTPATLKSGAQDKNFYRQLWETISAGRPFHAQIVNRRKDGTLYHAAKTITPMFDAVGQIVSYVNIDMDFTAQHEAQQRDAQLALHDTLTGLPNRTLFTDRIGQAIAQYARDTVPFAVLFIDLDGFKAINDSLGNQAGDEVLKEVACRLSRRLRSVDTVARIGGDEFVVLLPGMTEPAAASSLATELITVIRESIWLPSGACHVGASVGMSIFPSNGDTKDTILQSADRAMYEAKRAGGNQLRVAGAA